jgi:hypothetical protein
MGGITLFLGLGRRLMWVRSWGRGVEDVHDPPWYYGRRRRMDGVKAGG